jgi:phospholipase/carboxylesterase
MRESEEEVVIEPVGEHTGTVLWLHGLGADGYDFVPFVHELGLARRGLRVVLPHAPHRPVTINGGMLMRAWFDVRELDFSRDPDGQGIGASVDRVCARIAREVGGGVAAERVLLAGFSQGGAVALEAALGYAERLAGAAGLSTYLPRPEQVVAAPGNRGLPVFLGHGSRDPLIPLALARRSAEHLLALGCQVELRVYPMEHSVSAAEASDLARWLVQTLP